MTARDVLRRLTAAGCKAEVDPAGRLLVRPGYRLTDALRDLIRQERDGIVRELRRREVEAALRATCAELGLPLDAMRADPTGLRDVDLDELAEGWEDYRQPDLIRAYLKSIAFRLALDKMPPANSRAA
jgi:hypothetical protein